MRRAEGRVGLAQHEEGRVPVGERVEVIGPRLGAAQDVVQAVVGGEAADDHASRRSRHPLIRFDEPGSRSRRAEIADWRWVARRERRRTVAVMAMRPILPYALAFAAGAMIYVVIEEVIPETQRDKYTDIATLGFIGGFIVMMSLDVGLG